MSRDPHYMAQRSPKRTKIRAASYAAMYPALVRVARRLGYALAIHGSMARDFDLVAIPWTRFARPAEQLVEALRECSGGTETAGGATEKAHGRVAHTIYFGAGAYMDLSVMPRTAPFYESKRRVKLLLRELDAERDAHKLTEAAASAEAQRHDELLAEVRALKERLKLAEAVCESCRQQDRGYGQQYDHNALAAWRAGK